MQKCIPTQLKLLNQEELKLNKQSDLATWTEQSCTR